LILSARWPAQASWSWPVSGEESDCSPVFWRPLVLSIAALFKTGRLAELLGNAAGALAGLHNPALWHGLPRHVLEVAGQQSPPIRCSTAAGLGLTGLVG